MRFAVFVLFACSMFAFVSAGSMVANEPRTEEDSSGLRLLCEGTQDDLDYERARFTYVDDTSNSLLTLSACFPDNVPIYVDIQIDSESGSQCQAKVELGTSDDPECSNMNFSLNDAFNDGKPFNGFVALTIDVFRRDPEDSSYPSTTLILLEEPGEFLCSGTCAQDACEQPGPKGCTACDEPRFFAPDEDLDSGLGSCSHYCPEGTFENMDDRTCDPCAAGCTICGDSADECFACDQDDTDELYLNGRSCVPAAQCPPGTYPEQSFHFCVPCPEQCTECSAKDACSACASDFFINDDKCVRICPVGFTEVERRCEKCNEACSDCKGPTSSDCTVCAVTDPETFLKDGQCVEESECGTRSYAASGLCLACSDACENGCTGPERTDCVE